MTLIERAGYLARSTTPAYLKRVRQSHELISQHPDYAVGVSWGKDSVVMLHMAYSLGIRKAVHIRYYPQDRFPDTDQVRDRVLAAMPDMQYIEVACDGNWEMYEQLGRFIIEPETIEEKAILAEYEAKFGVAIAAGRDQLGATGMFAGMRADESRVRQLLTRTKGNDYETVDGRKTALPMAYWEGSDIWAYTVAHNLPWLRIYDFSPIGSRVRERSEPGFSVARGVGEKIRRRGGWQSWQAAYPDWWAVWVARWPEIRNYMV